MAPLLSPLRQATRRISGAALIGGWLFFVASLLPSLVPRTSLFQGMLSGISFAAGYGLFLACNMLTRFMMEPQRLPSTQAILVPLAAILAVLTLPFAWLWHGYQNELRAIMGARSASFIEVAPMLIFAVLTALLSLALGRAIAVGAKRLGALFRRVLPPRLALVLGVGAALLISWVILTGALFRVGLNLADLSFREMDQVIVAELDTPSDPMRTGSPQSLIEWQALGRQGRDYVGSGRTADEISAYTGRPASQPIRVYAGLNSGATPEERADLALRELQRVGGFDKSVLVVIAPTGTGWVDSGSVDPLEYLQGGDVASVSVQYSYLASWLSLIVEPDHGTAAAKALFRAVYDHWRQLPRDDRPRLYLHGLSLGSMSSERSFNMLELIADPIDGALWVGPPFPSGFWTSAVQGREPGTPAWLPTVNAGSVIRFANQDRRLSAAGGTWGPLRIAYLQYGSDPITFFETGSWLHRPEWMKGRRAPDVSARMRWVPLVTWAQLVVDMATGTTTPAGYGHVFACRDYADAWFDLLEPRDWPSAKLVDLCQHLGLP